MSKEELIRIIASSVRERVASMEYRIKEQEEHIEILRNQEREAASREARKVASAVERR